MQVALKCFCLPLKSQHVAGGLPVQVPDILSTKSSCGEEPSRGIAWTHDGGVPETLVLISTLCKKRPLHLNIYLTIICHFLLYACRFCLVLLRKVLPSTSSQRVTSVPYCGGFVAQLCPSAPTGAVHSKCACAVQTPTPRWAPMTCRTRRQIPRVSSVTRARAAWQRSFGKEKRMNRMNRRSGRMT